MDNSAPAIDSYYSRSGLDSKWNGSGSEVDLKWIESRLEVVWKLIKEDKNWLGVG